MTGYSLNQIEHTVRKAARGAGLSWGVAEDAGRAVRWLQMVGIESTGLVVAVLQELDHTQATAQRVVQLDRDSSSLLNHLTVLATQSNTTSPLVVGPCIGDWVNSIEPDLEDQEHEIVIANVMHPLLLAGYCGAAAQQTRQTITVEWDGFLMRCGSARARFDGASMRSKMESNVTITVGTDFSDTPCATAQNRTATVGASMVNADSWRQLEVFGHNTYVEATESSRLAGAGAGLSDND